MGAPNQQRPDLEQIIRERQDAARQAMYASGSETEQSTPTDFAGIARRATLLVLGLTGIALGVLIASGLVGGFAQFVFATLGGSEKAASTLASVVVAVFLLASVVAVVGSLMLLPQQLIRWIKTGRAS